MQLKNGNKIIGLLWLLLICGGHLLAQDTIESDDLEKIEVIEYQADEEDKYIDAPVDSTDAYIDDEDIDYAITQEDLITHPRTIPPSSWENIKNDPEYHYEYIAEKPPEKADLSWMKYVYFILKYLFILLGAAIVIFIIYSIYKNNFFFKWNKEFKETEDTPASHEQLQEFDKWDEAIQEALMKEDFRLAMRLHYLQTLQILDKRNLIKYHHEKTNWAYVNELRNKNPYKAFKNLTTYFDYVWYGKFDLSAEKYQVLKEEFTVLNRSIA